MFFGKRNYDTDTMAKRLALLGVHRKNSSMFLENDEIDTQAVQAFVERCGLVREHFLMAENVLRYTNVFNVLSLMLNLKDKDLEQTLLRRLREVDLFLDTYGKDQQASPKDTERQKALMERGFALLVDNLSFSQREITIGAHEMLATRFMNLVSDGSLATEDDKATWLALGFAIYQDLTRLREELPIVKKRLGLK